MAWVTSGVMAAEITSPAEARQNQLGYTRHYRLEGSDPQNKNTGNYATDSSGRADGLGFDIHNSSWVTMRSGYWMKTKGWFPTPEFFFYAAYDETDVSSDILYYINIDFDLYQIRLMEYNKTLGTTSEIDSNDDVTPLLGNINEWKHISLYHNTNTNSIIFWVNGVEFLSGSLSGSVPPAYLYATSFGGLTIVGGSIFVDDLYVDYSTISEVDDPPPARRYYPALPNGAGTYTNWTPDSGNNYDRVNELGTPDDDTSYVTTSANSTLDSYTFAALSGVAPQADPDSVVVQAYCRTSPIDGGVGGLKFMTRLGGLELSTASKRIYRQQENIDVFGNPVLRDWTVVNGYFDTKPTGGEWSETDFNNAEFGIEADGVI